MRPGDRGGVDVARRLAFDGAVAGLCVHPRHASQRHAGAPNYELVRELVDELPIPVLVSGGLQTAAKARDAFDQTGADGVLLARGSLGNPWLFEQLLGTRSGAADSRRRSSPSSIGWSTARASTSARNGPAATCASSTRGTSSASTGAKRCRQPSKPRRARKRPVS